MTEDVDAVLARLEWSDDCGVARVELRPGVWVDFLVWVDDEDVSREERVWRAGLALARLDARESDYRLWSAEHLVGNNWSDPPLTVDDIFELITVASLNVFDDGRADVYWDDQEELFGGHNVVTRLDRDGRPVAVEME